MANAGREPWTWSPARVEALEKAIDQGLSAGEFARQAGGGLTRNAALGKAFRMGLSFKSDAGWSRGVKDPVRERRSHKPARPAREARRPAPPKPERSNLEPLPLPKLRVVQTDGRFVGLLERADHGECKYIVNDPVEGAGAIYCAATAGEGDAYCPAHAAICYQPPKEKRKTRGDLRKFYR